MRTLIRPPGLQERNEMQDGMTIGSLAKAAGVSVETIRYYQRRGLIVEPRKPPGGHRRYAAEAVGHLVFIRRAQQLGFSLEEVKGLLRFSESGKWREAREMAEQKCLVLESRVEELTRMLRELKSLVDASREPPVDGQKPRLFEALTTPED